MNQTPELIFHKMNSKAVKQPEYIFLYGKTISLEMILRLEKHFCWTKRNLNWRTSPLSENELEKGTILFAHFYELLSLHEIYCLSFQALIKLPSTIAIATHNHIMIFSDFSQFLHTHTHTKKKKKKKVSFHFLFHVAVQASYGVV